MAKSEERKELSVDEKFALLLEALTAKQAGGIDAETLKTILSETQKSAATAMQKAMKPENADHPGISAFSHPDGDQAQPKKDLPFELFWNNYPVHKFRETESYAEWTLYSQLQPGEYTVIRKDLSKMTVKIEGERDSDHKLTKLTVSFPVSREEKWLVPPTFVTLYQLVNAGKAEPKRLFTEAMFKHLQLETGTPALA